MVIIVRYEILILHAPGETCNRGPKILNPLPPVKRGSGMPHVAVAMNGIILTPRFDTIGGSM